ncbi:MAG TPA: hypothetical protein VMN79_07740 [Casimicrobiaceae bacterium]|nr:hypothetical protein [Casimicrobiaceae bacterium]
MRRFTAVELGLVAFWLGYGVIALCVVYLAIPPVSRVLLLILGGYSILAAPVLVIACRRGNRFARNKKPAA